MKKFLSHICVDVYICVCVWVTICVFVNCKIIAWNSRFGTIFHKNNIKKSYTIYKSKIDQLSTNVSDFWKKSVREIREISIYSNNNKI